MSAVQHRAAFDFEISCRNGGSLSGRDFPLDIPGDAIDGAALAARIVEDMRLLMAGTVVLANVRVVAETHKRGAGGQAAAIARDRDSWRRSVSGKGRRSVRR